MMAKDYKKKVRDLLRSRIGSGLIMRSHLLLTNQSTFKQHIKNVI
jgi:hypothetical protein